MSTTIYLTYGLALQNFLLLLTLTTSLLLKSTTKQNTFRLFLRVSVKVCELGNIILAQKVVWNDCETQLE